MNAHTTHPICQVLHVDDMSWFIAGRKYDQSKVSPVTRTREFLGGTIGINSACAHAGLIVYGILQLIDLYLTPLPISPVGVFALVSWYPLWRWSAAAILIGTSGIVSCVYNHRMARRITSYLGLALLVAIMLNSVAVDIQVKHILPGISGYMIGALIFIFDMFKFTKR